MAQRDGNRKPAALDKKPWLFRGEWAICIALFVFLSSLYFATTSGITSSNDGSHYALTRALVEKGSFEISGYSAYAEGNDIARVGELKFSDRPPGTALVASLFYTAGGLLPPALDQLESRHDPENPRLLYVMLTPILAGTGAVLLLYLLLRELGVSTAGALAASLVFALGTAHWKYSTVLFSHAVSSFTVMLSVYLTIRTARSPSISWPTPLGLGFTLGYSVLVEYSNAILVIVIAMVFLTSIRLRAQRPFLYGTLFVIGGLVPAGFLATYNTINFGGPFTLSYAYASNYPWAASFSSTFDFPLWQGLRAMLVWGEGGGWCNPTCYNQGIFLLSPVLLFSFFGVGSYFRQSRRAFFLTTGLFFVYLLLFSKHRTFHGFTGDGRYLVPFLGLWCIPLGFAYDWTASLAQRPAWQTMARLLLGGLFFVSLRNIFVHIGSSYNYHLDLGQLGPLIASPENWAYLLAQIFRNIANLPLLWLLEGGILLLIYLIGRFNGWGTKKRLYPAL